MTELEVTKIHQYSDFELVDSAYTVSASKISGARPFFDEIDGHGMMLLFDEGTGRVHTAILDSIVRDDAGRVVTWRFYVTEGDVRTDVRVMNDS